jgi:hypothetical protein
MVVGYNGRCAKVQYVWIRGCRGIGVLRPIRSCMSVLESVKTIEICVEGRSIRGGLGIRRSEEAVWIRSRMESHSSKQRAQLDLVFVVMKTRNCKPVRL